MVTETGKFLRKLRIDRSEKQKDMADKLDVSVAFLSAVETGKKKMPASWINRICDIYGLTNKQRREFMNAVAETRQTAEIRLTDLSNAKRETVMLFAERIGKISDEQAERIRKVLMEENRQRKSKEEMRVL